MPSRAWCWPPSDYDNTARIQLMKPSLWGLKKSPWVYHVALSPCNNCDIEILDVLTPKFDVDARGKSPWQVERKKAQELKQ